MTNEPSSGTRVSRRRMLQTVSALTAGLTFFPTRSVTAAPRVKILSKSVISKQSHLYHGWPTVSRRTNGELLLVYSGGREAHVCPFGRVELMRSNDDGRSWTFPRVLLDSPIDDRDSGVVETAQGSLLVTTFTSLAYMSRLANGEKFAAADSLAWQPEKLSRWRAVHDRVAKSDHQSLLGSWMIRSTDGGQWWSAPYRCPVNTPHGPMKLADGHLLYIGTKRFDGKMHPRQPGVAVYESGNDGQNWHWLADLPAIPGDSTQQYGEPYAVETTDGILVIHTRYRSKSNERMTLQAESSDHGKSWTTPHAIGVRGFPSHLLRLMDGRLLMSYGFRHRPLGVQARISSDGGANWSEPIILSGDGTSTDVGYPSTIELDDGSLLTVWYELLGSWPGDVDHYHEKNRDEAWFKKTDGLRAVLRQAHWTIG